MTLVYLMLDQSTVVELLEHAFWVNTSDDTAVLHRVSSDTDCIPALSREPSHCILLPLGHCLQLGPLKKTGEDISKYSVLSKSYIRCFLRIVFQIRSVYYSGPEKSFQELQGVSCFIDSNPPPPNHISKQLSSFHWTTSVTGNSLHDSLG